MDFASKIFCSILSVVILVCLTFTFTIYNFYKQDMEFEFTTRYQTYGDTIGNIFHYLEIGSDLANKNAVYLLSEIEARKGLPSDHELDKLANKFGVNGFYIINNNGKFIRSSDLPIKQQINSLFSYNKEYRSLLTGNLLQLQIIDKGRGIEPNKIKDVLSGTSSKHDGKGLGLSSAKQQMEKMGGSLSLNSIYKYETEIILRFPIYHKPQWFPGSIRILKNSTVIILDDDVTIHNIWRCRLQTYDIKIFHFSSNTEILKWHEKILIDHQTIIYLIDYGLNDDHFNGLKLLETLKVKEHGYLITSYPDDIEIQQGCEKLGAWLVPKNLISIFPLST